VSEDANALYVTALAPGLEPMAIQLTVQDNRLTIAGEKPRVAAEIQPDAVHRSERAAGTFVRTVTLPIDVEHDQVQAEYTNGLLVVTLPKAAHVKPKQIAVSVAG
jgi:HSP20 family protein